MMKKAGVIAALTALALLAGCQPTPEKNVVTSKNDGTFQAALEADPAPDGAARTEAGGRYTDSFENANGSMRYELDLTAPEAPSALPVLQVRPMEITADLARRTAQAVLGQTEMYQYSSVHTKEDLEQIVLRLRRSVGDWEGLVEQCGGNEEDAAELKDIYADQLAEAEALYDQAPETRERAACDWQFHPTDYYGDSLYSDSFYGEGDNGYSSIRASAERDGVPFVFDASNREREDMRVHSISIQADDALADVSALYADAEESARSETVRAKALDIADAMGLGQWRVLTEEEAAVTGFADEIVLTRLYGGLPLTWHSGPSERETAYGPPYQYEALRMAFHGEEVVSFLYQGALEEVSTVNENVQTLPFEDILAAAETQMKLLGTTDALTGEAIPAREDGSYEKITVDGVQLGLTRILIQDNTTDYYLVPTYTFYGTAVQCGADGTAMDDGTYYDEDTGQTIVFLNRTAVELVVINAVDGSVIDPLLGY